MRINSKIKTLLPWMWCCDTFLYSLACPIVMCVVNRRLEVLQYAVPSLILSACGGVLSLWLTEKETMKRLYDRWFLQITVLDAVVWLGYFSLWLAGIVPDKWYPVACSMLHVSTVEVSKTVRTELENRMFPLSEDKTEFFNACGIVIKLYNTVACSLLIAASLKSMLFGQLTLMVAMVVDNGFFIWIWRRFEKNRRRDAE